MEDIPSWRKFTGQSEEETKGAGWAKALHPGDIKHTMMALNNAVATKRAYEVEYRLRRHDGAYRHFLARGVPVFKDDGEIQEWVGTCVDITERKRAEEELGQQTLELEQLSDTLDRQVRERTAELAKRNEELRQLSRKLLSAHEEERKRIAGEIHDTLGSYLGAIKFKAEEIVTKIEKTPSAVAELFEPIIPLIQEGIEECRRIQMDLRPPTLDDLGLLPTLSWFFRRFQTIYSTIQIKQGIDIDEGDVPHPLKIVVFRVIQEAMNNIGKYSKADFVQQSLGKLDGRLELVVQDNGQGFNLDVVGSPDRTRKGLGLTSMHEGRG